MPDALAWMHDPAEFDALVHEIFVEATQLSWTYPPRMLELCRLSESDPICTCRFVVRLFESPSFLLDRYTPAQIDAGIYRLLSWGELAWFPDGVNNQRIPVVERIRCLRSAECVYRDLFAPMYGEQVCGLGHAQSGHPNHACFMWWDILHVWPLDYRPKIDLIRGDPTEIIRSLRDEYEPTEPAVNDIMINELFDLFARVLHLDSDECCASVLHGIGHHQDMHPERALATVAAFLERNPDLRPELREYAERAAQGHVL